MAEGWLRGLTPLDGAGLVFGIAVFTYLGSDGAIWEPRPTIALHLVGAGVIVGLVVAAARGVPMPRTPVELPLLALIAAFALATASALNHGMSLRAFASIMAYAFVLPAALVAVRRRPTWVGLVVAVPTLLLAAPGLWVLLERRLEWIAAGAPGLPPIRLPSEGSPFGSVAVPPFVLWPAWAIAGLIAPTWLRRAVQGAIVVVAVPYTILSGSRSAWLAIGATALVIGVPWAWSRRDRVRNFLRARPRLGWSAALAGLATLGGLAVLIAPRVTAATSLLYRFDLWRDTLTAWATDPLSGIGPGFMPIARQAAAADGTFPVRQPHSHNIPLGVLGDAGLLGLAAAVVLVVVLAAAAGPWRSRTARGRAAATILVGLGFAGLFEDITFMPNFVLMVIVLAAIALTDGGAVTWRPMRLPRRLLVPAAAAGATAAAILLAATLTADAGAFVYRLGVNQVFGGQWREGIELFDRSMRIDPWHPSAPKALAIAAAHVGQKERARAAAEIATARNPGDGQAWTNLALLCGELGDDPCRRRAAERAAATAEFSGAELVNAALVFGALGDTEAADGAYRGSLLSQRLTTLAVDWPRTVSIGDASLAQPFGAFGEVSRLLALRAAGDPIDPGSFGDPAVRALAHAMLDERGDAEAALEEAMIERPGEIMTWEITVVLLRHWGEPYDHALRIGELVRGGGFPPDDRATSTPPASGDLAVFRILPADGLVGGAERLKTVPSWPWILAEILPQP